jgi:hypothetical protein
VSEDSIQQLRAALVEVSERLQTAYRCASSAEQALAEALAVLTRLSRSHHEQLVPSDLLGAHQELTRGLGLISGGADSVAAVDARL